MGLDPVELLGQERALAILRTSIPEAAGPAMEAAVAGGFRVLEFTLNTVGALELIRRFSARKGLCVGAGTVLSVGDARAAVDAGARFLVSPVFDDAVVAEASRLGVPVVPGCHTPTELLRAHAAGAALQKLFPAPASGPAYLRSCLGPMPFLRVVPTSGVTEDNAAAWLSAGAYAVGFVAPLFRHEDLAGFRFDAVRHRARRMLAATRGAHERRPLEEMFTKRLRLRRAQLEDAPVIFERYATDLEVARYLSWRPHQAVTETEAFLGRVDAAWRVGGEVAWVIERVEDGVLLGMIGLTVEGHEAEVGYVLARDAWGNGYMTEAVQEVSRMALTLPGVTRLWALVDADNGASARVLERAGFEREGTLPRLSVHPNLGEEPRDCLCYGKLGP